MFIKRCLAVLIVVFCVQFVPVLAADSLFSAAYGSPLNPAVIFLHGGPGYNSVGFEYSTAESMARQGYYVVVFDQRGCGRSKNIPKSEYTFSEAVEDLNLIYTRYHLKKATLMGHSWGGTLGLMFGEKYPKKVERLILVSAPLSYQKTFRAIIANSRRVYKKKESTLQLTYLEMLEKMDTTALSYANYCFMHAMSSGLYQPGVSTDTAKALYKSLKECPKASYLQDMTTAPVSGFYANEKYTVLDLRNRIRTLRKKVKVYGIYGDEDGLFSTDILDEGAWIMGQEDFKVISGASHNVFIDQQEAFLKAFSGFCGKRYLFGRMQDK